MQTDSYEAELRRAWSFSGNRPEEPDLPKLLAWIKGEEVRSVDPYVFEDRCRQTPEWLLRSTFSALLKHYLAHLNYDTSKPDLRLKLAQSIPQWQENERSLPYDPLLVKSWTWPDKELRKHKAIAASKEQKLPLLPDVEAWDGIRYYMIASNVDESPQNAIPVDLLDALYCAAHDQYRETQSDQQQRYTSEQQQTAWLRCLHAEQKMDEIAKACGTSTVSLGKKNIATEQYSPQLLQKLDTLLHIYQPPLTSIYWHQTHARAAKLYDDASASECNKIGSQISALCQSVNLEAKTIAEALGISSPGLARKGIYIGTDGISRESLTATPQETITSEQLRTLLGLIQQQQEKLSIEYPSNGNSGGFIPLMNDSLATALIKSLERFRDQNVRHKSPDVPWDVTMDAELLVLDREFVEKTPDHPEGRRVIHQHKATIINGLNEAMHRTDVPVMIQSIESRLYKLRKEGTYGRNFKDFPKDELDKARSRLGFCKSDDGELTSVGLGAVIPRDMMAHITPRSQSNPIEKIRLTSRFAVASESGQSASL